jgi:hypothetical protein
MVPVKRDGHESTVQSEAKALVGVDQSLRFRSHRRPSCCCLTCCSRCLGAANPGLTQILGSLGAVATFLWTEVEVGSSCECQQVRQGESHLRLSRWSQNLLVRHPPKSQWATRARCVAGCLQRRDPDRNVTVLLQDHCLHGQRPAVVVRGVEGKSLGLRTRSHPC